MKVLSKSKKNLFLLAVASVVFCYSSPGQSAEYVSCRTYQDIPVRIEGVLFADDRTAIGDFFFSVRVDGNYVKVWQSTHEIAGQATFELLRQAAKQGWKTTFALCFNDQIVTVKVVAN